MLKLLGVRSLKRFSQVFVFFFQDDIQTPAGGALETQNTRSKKSNVKGKILSDVN